MYPYVYKSYFIGFMEERNRYMVEYFKYYIYALLRDRSGTSQTVSIAKEHNRIIRNILATLLSLYIVRI